MRVGLQRLSQTIVSAASSGDFSFSFIFSQNSGMASLTEGVSDHPGCMETKKPLFGFLLAIYSMRHSCCLLLRAYWAVPSKSSCSMKTSSVFSFCVRHPPELTVIVLDFSCSKSKQRVVRQQTASVLVAKFFSILALVYCLSWIMHPPLCTKTSICLTLSLSSEAALLIESSSPNSQSTRQTFLLLVSQAIFFRAASPLSLSLQTRQTLALRLAASLAAAQPIPLLAPVMTKFCPQSVPQRGGRGSERLVKLKQPLIMNCSFLSPFIYAHQQNINRKGQF